MPPVDDGQRPAATPMSSPPAELDPATLEVMIRAITASGRYRIVERLARRTHYHLPSETPTKTALYVDVETTGLEPEDRIIQLAVVPFEFDHEGRIYGVGECEAWYEDPGRPIPEAVTRLTGIRDDDVRDRRIDDDRVGALLDQAVLVIAHNARFDRPRLEERIPAFREKHWACSCDDIPWTEEGIESAKLEWLAYRLCGMFYETHRADSDCYMGIHLLATSLPSGRLAMDALLESARRPMVRIWAFGSDIAKRHALKRRGYRWSDGDAGRPKGWWRDVAEESLAEEVARISAEAYSGPWDELRVQRHTARHRYSLRIDGLEMRPCPPLRLVQ